MTSWYRRLPYERRSRALRTPLEHEPLEMGERLRGRKAPERRRKVVAEQLERHLVRQERCPLERRFRAIEAVRVMGRNLSGATGGIRDGLAMARIGDAR